jgi:DNA-binding MarR family transcriptional regulator
MSVNGRSTLGQFLPGPRYTAEMARVEAAVLANPGMSARALAKKLGVSKTTVLRARERLNNKHTVETEPADAAVAAHPDMSVNGGVPPQP